MLLSQPKDSQSSGALDHVGRGASVRELHDHRDFTLVSSVETRIQSQATSHDHLRPGQIAVALHSLFGGMSSVLSSHFQSLSRYRCQRKRMNSSSLPVLLEH